MSEPIKNRTPLATFAKHLCALQRLNLLFKRWRALRVRRKENAHPANLFQPLIHIIHLRSSAGSFCFVICDFRF
jgi:hypothetical protein